tara:strand:- start:557 stop:2449 length:1893 start_codon:yes stop_codon:yes gene_type:complete
VWPAAEPVAARVYSACNRPARAQYRMPRPGFSLRPGHGDRMSIEIVIVFALVLGVFYAFITEKFPPEVVALGASAILLATGVLTANEFLSVFSNAAPITIAMMFIMSAALERTGLLEIVSEVLRRAATGSVLRASLVMMVFVMLASAFMNNTPIVVLLTPAVISLAGSLGIAPSKLLIPLSFSAIFGGTLTLVGTSTNILMSTVAVEAGEAPISMFEMTLPGLIFSAVGLVYLLFAGRFLLPDRFSLASVLNSQPKRQFLAEVLITPGSRLIGRPIGDVPLARDEAGIIDVVRGNISLRAALKAVVLQAGDRLVIETNAGQLVGLRKDGQIEFRSSGDDFAPVSAEATVLLEVSLGQRSSLIGKRISELYLRRKYGVYLLAVHRNDVNLSRDFDTTRLRFADTLLLEGPAEGIKRLLDEGDVINLSQPAEQAMRRSRAPIALGVILVVMGLAAFDIMPIAGLAVIGAVIVLVTGCVEPKEGFDAIDWRILFLIFGMLGLSLGLEKTGAAQLLVEFVVHWAEGVGPVGVLLAVYVLTSALTEMVSNNAVAVLIGPLVIAIAHQLGLDPKPFIMAVMFAASASFATPIGYQTNTFVYGAGGYKFMDFVRVGLPLNIIFAIIAVVIIPIFYPF